MVEDGGEEVNEWRIRLGWIVNGERGERERTRDKRWMDWRA